ncbi:UDP-glucose 4-epimerase [Granulicatella balaenopterae]|uniref:UDP-glucose 4-epimerase n=1 Tax=Granulicatella balaenopterae TaxID=137733 RepID=A0A1H9JAX3_9LACT|nr:UDP-glucose 4-epimerase GalE [Granulicatella balaenopterae]SEQ83937.1 UDP-glucose 4-epimerase [Granulicatella balaenopterae]
MTILVTGGAGYIGSHTVIELLKQNEEVIIVDNFCNSVPEVLNRINIITGKDIIMHEGDVQDKEFLRDVFSQYDFDAVIHFAGYKAVGESVEQPLKYYQNNIAATLNLVEVMTEFNVKSIVFSSSATVYGMNNQVPFNETMPTSATNPYGYSKLMVEQILTDIANSDADWAVTNLRYFNPIGAHESSLIGECPNGIPNNLMPYVTQVAIGEREELSVFGNDYDTHDGTGVRDYIHVTDLAKGHVLAINYNRTHKGATVVNLGTGIGYSVLDLVKTFEEINKVPVPYKICDRRPGDIATCYADATKAKELLGWQAEKTLEDMVRDSWNWQAKNPHGYHTK